MAHIISAFLFLLGFKLFKVFFNNKAADVDVDIVLGIFIGMISCGFGDLISSYFFS